MARPGIPRAGRYLADLAPTPLVPIRLAPGDPLVHAKLEFLNPSGSTKDRIARTMLDKAWRRGDVGPGGRVVEASSGSTSIALALVCAQMGLSFTAVMPEGVSRERLLMIRAFGAEIELTPAEEGLPGSLSRAEALAAARGDYYTRQFENPDNVEAHRLFTAEEILARAPDGRVDAVVAGVGTGGTLAGLHRGFREAGCAALPYAARPIQGIGLHAECCTVSRCVPGVVEGLSKLLDDDLRARMQTVDVDDADVIDVARRLIRLGFPVGPSSGLSFAAAREVARDLPEEAVVVTVLPDRMERYFSTELFAHCRS